MRHSWEPTAATAIVFGLATSLLLADAATDACTAENAASIQEGEESPSISLLQAQQDVVRRAGRSVDSTGPFVNTTTLAYELNDGRRIPVIGFGTYRIPPGNDTYSAVSLALAAGYRMLDTAETYLNEADVGRAVRDSGIPRSEIFVETKVWDAHHGFDSALAAGRASSARLGLGYIDLLVIHSPSSGRIVETYDALLQLRDEGVIRSAGVSNFGVPHLQALADYCRPAPAVNQFELHPLIFNDREELVSYCRNHGILVQAYGSILSGHDDLLALADSIAASHGKTSAQVMLRWALDQGFQVIPKSTHDEYIRENFDVMDFSLTESEREQLNALHGSLGEYWNPLTAPVDVGNVGPQPVSC